MSASPLLLAEAVTRTRFEWGRIQSNSDWVLPVVACLAIMLLVRYLYQRDAQELHPLWGWLLTALRTAVFYGLLVLYLEPQWRTEREVFRNSRVLLLADTSLSMRQTDAGGPSAKPLSRAEQLAATLASSDLLPRLRKTHDVVVLRFDQELGRLATLEKLSAEPTGEAAAAPPDPPTASPAVQPIAWDKLLVPSGPQTRLGQAIQEALQEEQGAPPTLAGVVVFSDGAQNAGIGPESAVQSAREAKIPIFTVGLGSDRQPANVRVSDLAAPPRAYPGDRYTVVGYIQAQGLAGRVAAVELLSRPTEGASGKPAGGGDVEGTQQVTLGAEGEIVPVTFELVPDRAGRRTLVFRVRAPAEDHNPDDNQREADVEIVDRKNRVLLLAGGPGREYQFLRALLYRDRSTLVDVLLQTAQPGVSQEANQLLDEFPDTREEMFNYDCLVAVDPDWQALGPARIDLIENWVAEQGGGAIVIAGQVYAGRTINGWVQDPAMAKVRALYPVEFLRNLAVADTGAHAGKDPWPLDFTREGLDAQFLWLEDTAAASQRTWAQSRGVYEFFPVRGPKPGATVLARFSDPRFAAGGEAPVYMAGQFYGSGRVFYLGSAEMWRLRSVDDAAFEKFYIKTIRHVSQGRLLRGSVRGVLLVGQDHGYLLGSSVEVRAQLTNAQLDPLDVPNVSLQVIQPDGATSAVRLDADPSRPGTFAGQFTAAQEGTYRLELPIPESADQRLTRRVQVKMPDLELENPQRNDALLSRLAQATGGQYYVGIEAALDAGSPRALCDQLKDRSKTQILPAAPSPEWEQQWLRWMMFALCGVLCLEWLIRRLWKLA